MTDLASLVVRMQADNSQYIKALDQATAKLNKFAHEQENAFTQLKDQFVELGAKFAAGFAIEKIIEFTASSIESAAALERLSQTTGISTESLSALRLAAAASGLSADEMGVAYKKLNVSIEEAAGNAQSKAAVAFKALGISVTDASGNLKTADQILPELADKFASFADGPNKVALAVALLGKQGQNLIPVLNQGSAG
ncbi:MAG TPA: phage tail tape measure protein, partial [Gemmatimonadaceae bacterium]|nr:phage tail tape measure protein [Gemmatimonadaceae bacterium]